MGSITPYESAKGRRYRVRCRRPDRSEAEKRGFTTMREAKLYLSMVTVSKSKGEYSDPSTSRVPLRMFADSWLRSKQPPMSKPSYYMTLERAWKNHVAPVWAHREISSIRRSEVQDWVSDLATQKSRTVLIRALGVSLESLTSRSTIAASPAIPPAGCVISLGTGPASTSRTTRWQRWRRAPHIRRSS